LSLGYIFLCVKETSHCGFTQVGGDVSSDGGIATTHEVPLHDALLPVLLERVTDVSSFAKAKEISLPRAAATYIMFKRKRLTASSERGYQSILNEFTKHHPGLMLGDFEPPRGNILIEDFLTARWGESAPRTYNKGHSVLCDFFSWHVARDTMERDPMATIERAKARPPKRITFSKAQVAAIFAANHEPRDQIALRLLLHYAIRKGALRGVQLEHFDHEKRTLTVFTKGEQFHTLPIVEDRIWELLADLGEPGHHYLLPKQKLRKRISPSRAEFAAASEQLGDLLATLTAIDDTACAIEPSALAGHAEHTVALLSLTVAAASVQVRMFAAEQMGEHGTHLWWYRCLTRAGVVEPGTTSGRKLHSARHTAIQAVLDTTGNLRAAQAVAGHKNVGTTGDNYTDWTEGQTEKTLRDTIGVPS
jgi:integrase